MSKKKHRRGASKHKFCGTPGTPCTCESPNNYRKVCEPTWSTLTFTQIKTHRKGERKGQQEKIQRGYEAHHILCVSSISKELVTQDEVDRIVSQTRWCINAKNNMMALPLWGQTVLWYLMQAELLTIGGIFVAPVFQNLPQHDWDHNHPLGYTKEIDDCIKDIRSDVKNAGHNVKPEDLAGDLEALSRAWEGKLKTRGARAGGTHAAFIAGLQKPDADFWCLPFSMASTANISKKGFPVKRIDDKFYKWAQKIVSALWR